jgi:hypothetical protein
LPALSDGGYETIAITDLNGDGKPDLLTVVTNFNTAGTQTQFQAFLNNGKGGYTQAAPGPLISSTSGIDPYSCVTVDLTGNGKPSLACGQPIETATTQTFSVALYPSNGDGTFGAPATYAIPGLDSYSNWYLLVGDFNGDGKQDVALWQQNASSNNGAVTVSMQAFLSDGQGGLQAPKGTQIQGPVPNGLIFFFGNILAGDVNGDGKADLLLSFVGDDSAGQIQENVVLTLLGAGDGAFITPGVSTTFTAETGNEWIDGMALLDYSGSGHPGLVYTTDTGLLQAFPGNGDGSFGAPTAATLLPSNLTGWELFPAKMTSSGRQDLIIVTDDSVGILLNTGSSGSLGTPVFYPTSSPNYIAAVDWDADGNTDIVTFGDDGIDVLKGQGDGTVLDAIGLYPPANAAEPAITSMIPIDINGKGRTDFVFSQLTESYANNATTASTTFSAFMDDGKGGYTVASNVLTIPSNSAYSYVDVVGTADFNGDGKPDLLLEVYKNSTNGSGIRGTDELVGIALNNGNGTFTFPLNPATGVLNMVSGTTFDHNPIADVNGDGKPDVLLSTGSGIAIYLGDGTGNLVTSASTIPLAVAAPGDAIHIAVGDVNGDGKQDLLVSFDQTVEWFPGAGGGTFGQPNTISAITGNSSPIALGDWNTDGALDLVVGQDGQLDAAGQWMSPYIEILTNDGKGNFAEIGKITDINLDGFSFTNTDGQLPRDGDIYVADLNGDGHPDLVVTGESQDIHVALGKGDGTFAPSLAIGSGNSPDRIMFATVQGAPNSIATFDAEEGEYLTLLLNQASLTTSLTASAASISTGGTLTLQAAISPVVTGSPVPTGTVNFLEGSSVLGSVELTSGTASYSLSNLTAGSHTYTAQYSGDSNYQPVNLSGVTVTVTTPIVTSIPSITVTPSAETITNQQAVTVAVSVAGANGEVAPTGTVTLASGDYSAQQSLTSGTASFTIAAGSLPAGANILTATYSGDGIFAGINATTTVTVSQAVVTAPAPSPVSAGASATATATITAGSTYSGTMNLSCALTGSPSGAQSVPTCSLSPASVTIASGGSGNSVLTVKTTAASTTSSLTPFGQDLWRFSGGGAALAALLMFGIPARSRRWLSMIVLFVVIFAGTIGCGGRSTTTSTVNPATPATTSGKYTFTVTGTDSANSKITTSTSVLITVQ